MKLLISVVHKNFDISFNFQVLELFYKFFRNRQEIVIENSNIFPKRDDYHVILTSLVQLRIFYK